MSFQDIAKSVRSAAASSGIDLTMSRMNDAIALACYGKKYAAVVAAEKAGKLAIIPTPPPNITAAARQYRVDEYAFGLALRAGIEGPAPSAVSTPVGDAMAWLLSRHRPEINRLEQQELLGLADRTLVDRVLSEPEYQVMAVLGFVEWVIAEGEVHHNGRWEKAAEVLLHSKSHPAWNARQRAYLAALAATPLRLYVVESVTAAYQLTLRPVGVAESSLLQVSERAGSRPGLVGSFIGARVMARGDHLEMAGGVFPLNQLTGIRLSEQLRLDASSKAVSRAIRSAWFQQFDQPRPQVVLADSGEPLRLVTDTYRCAAVDVLAHRLASDPGVEGNADLGWSVTATGKDGRARPMCSINLEEDAPSHVTVFYESEGRAAKYRPWFEALVGDAATFVGRESLDPFEAAMDPTLEESAKTAPRLPKEALSAALAAEYRRYYEDSVDRPVPMLDGASPRQMLQRPGGEARVRELVALFESNERRLAQQDQREPLDFAFLYQKLGLTRIEAPVVTRGPGMHPDQFAVNEAWIIFRLFDDPMQVQDVTGGVAGFGLMDAGSTCMLNFQLLPVGRDFSELEARSFFQSLKVPKPPRPPRRLFFGSDVDSDALTEEASRLKIPFVLVNPTELDGIVAAARNGFSDRLEPFR